MATEYYHHTQEGFSAFSVKSYYRTGSLSSGTGCTPNDWQDKGRWYSVDAQPSFNEDLRTLPDSLIDSGKNGDTNAKWSRVKKSREIRMTNYSVYNSNTKFFVAQYSRAPSLYGYAIQARELLYNNNCPGYGCNYCWLPSEWQPANDRIVTKVRVNTLRTDSSKLSTDFPGISSFMLNPGSDPSERMKVMADVVSKSSFDFDLLTNLAESKETLGLLIDLINGIRNPIKSLQNLARSTRKNPLKKGSEAWLTYRYGIMPVIFSVQDAIKLLKQRGFLYQTFRSQGSSDLKFPERDMSVPHIFNMGAASLTYRGTGKVFYESSALRLLSRISVNPAITFWELVPWSFVVDWFVDVSGFIHAHTLALTSMATDYKYCVSEKMNYSLDTFLYIPPSSTVTDIPLSHYGYEDNGLYGNQAFKDIKPQQITYSQGGEFRLSSENLDSYSREVFQPGDIELQAYVDLNWLRQLDALALSSLKLNQFLRKLK